MLGFMLVVTRRYIQAFTHLPLSTIFHGKSTSLLLYDMTATPPIPIPLRIGDVDLDGFPDLLPIIAYDDGSATPELLISIACTKGAPGCLGARGRTFERLVKDVVPLGHIKDARGVAFLDLDDDVGSRMGTKILSQLIKAHAQQGTLDIMVQRTGQQSGTNNAQVTFIQNNFFHDAFFLKAIGKIPLALHNYRRLIRPCKKS